MRCSANCAVIDPADRGLDSSLVVRRCRGGGGLCLVCCWPGRRQRDALRADVRAVRAGPGRGSHGAHPGRPSVRVAAARRGLLLPYHLGRLTTYAGLGAVAATLGSTLSRLPWLAAVSAACCCWLPPCCSSAQALRRLAPRLRALLPDRRPRRPAGPVVGRLTHGWTDNPPGRPAAWGGARFPALRLPLCRARGGVREQRSGRRSACHGRVRPGHRPGLVAVGIAGQAAGRRWQRAAARSHPR